MVHSDRAQRSRAEDTHRSQAIGQCCSYAQPPISTASAPRALVSGLPALRLCIALGEYSRGGHPCSLHPRRRGTSGDATPFRGIVPADFVQ